MNIYVKDTFLDSETILINVYNRDRWSGKCLQLGKQCVQEYKIFPLSNIFKPFF